MIQKIVTIQDAKIKFEELLRNRSVKVNREMPFHNAYWYKGEWLFSTGYFTEEMASRYSDKSSANYAKFCATDAWENSYTGLRVTANDPRNSVHYIGIVNSQRSV